MKLIVTLSAIVLTLSPAAFAQNTNPTGQPTGQSKSEAGAGGRSNSSADTAPGAAGQDGLPSRTPSGSESTPGETGGAEP